RHSCLLPLGIPAQWWFLRPFRNGRLDRQSSNRRARMPDGSRQECLHYLTFSKCRYSHSAFGTSGRFLPQNRNVPVSVCIGSPFVHHCVWKGISRESFSPPLIQRSATNVNSVKSLLSG